MPVSARAVRVSDQARQMVQSFAWCQQEYHLLALPVWMVHGLRQDAIPPTLRQLLAGNVRVRRPRLGPIC